jgi:hypothetical protein
MIAEQRKRKTGGTRRLSTPFLEEDDDEDEVDYAEGRNEEKPVLFLDGSEKKEKERKKKEKNEKKKEAPIAAGGGKLKKEKEKEADAHTVLGKNEFVRKQKRKREAA